jgi:(p)ppGpp synthase/HD superfamily hydrolase
MTLEKAILIATTAHQGQVDKAGAPYILHPFRVMFGCKTEDEQICAVLHDIIEDTVVTLVDLRTAGFKEEIIIALDALTKRKNEAYDDFINRLIQNQLACHVKLADLSDNMNLSRIPHPLEEDYQRVEKYGIAADRIVNALVAFTDDYRCRYAISFKSHF